MRWWHIGEKSIQRSVQLTALSYLPPAGVHIKSATPRGHLTTPYTHLLLAGEFDVGNWVLFAVAARQLDIPFVARVSLIYVQFATVSIPLVIFLCCTGVLSYLLFCGGAETRHACRGLGFRGLR